MDYAGLRLKYHGNPEKLDEVLQAECRDKCSRKLPALVSNPDFRFPSTALAEMSTSEAVAEIHASLVQSGERVLDMTFGLGVDAFAMSRKGASVTGIDLDEKAYLTATHNIAALGHSDNITIIRDDSVRWLAESGRHFDTIFIDPQRRDNTGRHFALAQCLPDVTTSLDLLRGHCRRLMIKMSPMIDIKAVKSELEVEKCRIIIIGTTKECKEVLMILSDDIPADITECLTIGRPSLIYDSTSSGIQPVYTDPRPGNILLEPFPSVMKGVTTGSLRHINAPKIAPNTHLFISLTEEDAADLPGEKMLIHEVIPFSKTAIRTFAAVYPVINVAVRNFPLSAPELARRLKVREGGDRMVHGVTLNDGSRVLIVTGMPY